MKNLTRRRLWVDGKVEVTYSRHDEYRKVLEAEKPGLAYIHWPRPVLVVCFCRAARRSRPELQHENWGRSALPSRCPAS